jgi:hypothetical protein
MKISEVKIYETSEKLPSSNSMIICFDGQWWIAMYEKDDIACQWEDEEEIKFTKWAYLEDLNHSKRKTK